MILISGLMLIWVDTLMTVRGYKNMETICVILSWEDTSVCAIDRIEAEFPCFTWIREINDDIYEATITARIEDVPSIERILAPFV